MSENTKDRLILGFPVLFWGIGCWQFEIVRYLLLADVTGSIVFFGYLWMIFKVDEKVVQNV